MKCFALVQSFAYNHLSPSAASSLLIFYPSCDARPRSAMASPPPACSAALDAACF